jgi:hypothetical protein
MAGYWKKSRQHTEVFACFKEEACLGGLDSECATGYMGNLCHSCKKEGDTWYNKKTDQSCQECVDYKQNVGLMIGILMVVMVYICILVFINV